MELPRNLRSRFIKSNQCEKVLVKDASAAVEANAKRKGRGRSNTPDSSNRNTSEIPESKIAKTSEKVQEQPDVEKPRAAFHLGENEYFLVIRVIDEFVRVLRLQPGFKFHITSVAVAEDRLIINYVIIDRDHDQLSKTSTDNQEELVTEGPTKLERLIELSKILKERHLLNIRQYRQLNGITSEEYGEDWNRLAEAVRSIIPTVNPESIWFISLNHVPRFMRTTGLSLSLSKDTKIRRHTGLITALLRGQSTGTSFALTIGHGKNIGDKFCITVNGSFEDIGVVQEVIVDNGVHLYEEEYVDAALVKLQPRNISKLGLKQKFLIGSSSHNPSNIEPAQVGKLVLRAVDQRDSDVKGIIVSTRLNILENLPPLHAHMHKCILISRYSEDQIHQGVIHEREEGGLLCSCESKPLEPESSVKSVPSRVKSMVMLIGYYALYDTTTKEYSYSSVGVDLQRVLKRMENSANVKETLEFMNTDS